MLMSEYLIFRQDIAKHKTLGTPLKGLFVIKELIFFSKCLKKGEVE